MASSGAPPSPFLDHLLALVASYDSGTALPSAYPHASTKAPDRRTPASSNDGSSMGRKAHDPPTPESTPGASNGARRRLTRGERGSEQLLHDSGPVGVSATDELQLLKAQV
ncbi:hypothetical protein FRC01_012834 [Tulasnella sp. 417]|nr:hypothetical protein FRC01_012834 [Tulasnella sp. 417]